MGRAAVTDAKPYTKESQLARGPRKYRRKVASPKQWQAIIAAKCEAGCRICKIPPPLFDRARHDPHHLIPTDWHGDDVADNIIGLCRTCHGRIEVRHVTAVRLMLTRLSDAEYAYAVGKAGEAWAERIYGVEYER